MKVNGLRFFVSVFKHIFFRTISYCENGEAKTFAKCLQDIQRVAEKRGFRVIQFDLDGEFQALQQLTNSVNINIVSRDEHVPRAERNVRTIKDRLRGTLASLPFQKIPNRMLIELAFGQVFWLNAFPNKYGISKTLSPRAIMTGKEIDFKNTCESSLDNTCKHTSNIQTTCTNALSPLSLFAQQETTKEVIFSYLFHPVG